MGDAVALINRVYEVSGKQKVTIWAYSLGCAVAIAAANRDPSKIKKMLLCNPFTSMHATMFNMVPGVTHTLLAPSILLSTDSWNSLKRLQKNPDLRKIPTMVLSNSGDPVIKPWQHDAIHANCDNTGDILKAPGDHIGIHNHLYIPENRRRIHAFLENSED